MAKVKVGINGLGRIGRTILRNFYERNNREFEVVAANDISNQALSAHLLRYDSTHGRFAKSVKLDGDVITVDGDPIKVYAQKDPAEIPWHQHGVQIVIDATGVFKDPAGLGKHMKGSASVKKVVMCAPGSNLDGTFVMGVNSNTYDNNKHHIISNGSCTTNCLAPITKVLNESWGIEYGTMCTIHSYTLDQQILDAQHSDWRRARAGAVSMIPTSTGAAKAIGEVIPDLKGKLDGYAIRVPTPNVSVVDFAVKLKKTPSKQEINQAMKAAAETSLKGILGYCDEELVSVDFMGQTYSSIFDSKLTNVVGDLVKVVSWYDNETGFSNRVIDLVGLLGSKLAK